MTEKDNSATMQGIRILQSWNCVLEDCKIAKIIEIALLRCWGESRKAAATRQRKAAPSARTEKPPAGRKGTFDKAERVESAFALLSQKVTKAMRRIRRLLPDKGERKIY